MVFRELSFSRLECGVHDRLHIYPLCGVFYFPWHIHQIEGTNGFYCLIRKTERFTISNVESQVFTPNHYHLPLGLNAGGPRPKRVSYHWTTAPLVGPRRLSYIILGGCPFNGPLSGTKYPTRAASPIQNASTPKSSLPFSKHRRCALLCAVVHCCAQVLVEHCTEFRTSFISN